MTPLSPGRLLLVAGLLAASGLAVVHCLGPTDEPGFQQTAWEIPEAAVIGGGVSSLPPSQPIVEEAPAVLREALTDDKVLFVVTDQHGAPVEGAPIYLHPMDATSIQNCDCIDGKFLGHSGPDGRLLVQGIGNGDWGAIAHTAMNWDTGGIAKFARMSPATQLVELSVSSLDQGSFALGQLEFPNENVDPSKCFLRSQGGRKRDVLINATGAFCVRDLTSTPEEFLILARYGSSSRVIGKVALCGDDVGVKVQL